MPKEATDRADLIFRALSSKQRREILRLLAKGEDAEATSCCSTPDVCACVLADKLGLGAPTVSHHMRALLDAGLVAARKQGLWVYYSLSPDAAETVAEALGDVLGAASGAPR